jgi:hypothetical protein
VPGGLYEREDELARVDALMTAAGASRGGVSAVAAAPTSSRTGIVKRAHWR